MKIDLGHFLKTPSKNVLKSMLDGQPNPMILVDAEEGGWRILYFNPAFLRLADLSAGEVSGQSAQPLLEQLGGSGLTAAIEGVGEFRPQQEFSFVLVGGDEPDRQVTGKVSLTTSSSQLRAVYFEIGVVHDSPSGITASLSTLPSDAVTVFLRRDPWLALLRRDAAIAAREQSWLAVIVFRVDALASYIETFGQHAGDSALKRISHSIRRRLQRAGDTAARIADDELAVLVHSTTAPAARKFADAISEDIQALAIHHPKSPLGRHLTLSVGVCARVPRNEDDATAMLEQARSQIDAPDGIVTLYPLLDDAAGSDQ
ncbi:MAG: diguanylate cyclase [Pseudomonadota bacterium]